LPSSFAGQAAVPTRARFSIVAALLACLVVAAHAVPVARASEVAKAIGVVGLPSRFEGGAVALTDAEQGLFERVGRTRAEKYRFSWNGIEGTALFVSTESWRAHHPPEICLAAGGFRIERMEDLSGGEIGSFRVLSLDHGSRTNLYWFQSRSRATPDLADRVLADVAGREKRWVLVSVLIDTPAEKIERELFAALAQHVSEALAASEGGSTP
jgi:exosortase O